MNGRTEIRPFATSDREHQQSLPTEMLGSFEEVVLPHLDAAYRLARWLIRNEQDAEDAVQEASLRAFRYFRTFAGGNGRAWYLRIVRNTCYGWRGFETSARVDSFDEDQHSHDPHVADPEALLLHTDDVKLIEQAMRGLPERFRELLVLRELEGLTYRELADVMGIPIGTVMSGLSRARHSFGAALDDTLKQYGIAKKDVFAGAPKLHAAGARSVVDGCLE